MTEKTKRTLTLERWTSLKAERDSWIPQWQEISENLLPRSGRFIVTDRNKGDNRYNRILDSTGTRALRVLGAGLMSGATSPARPWFRLTTSDPELDESSNVKQWLADVQRLMLMVFARSNTYRSLHTGYEEMGAFGTSADIVLTDFDEFIRHYPLTAGEYAIATDYKGNVNTLYREFEKTVAELVGEFGRDRVSQTVKNLYDRGNLDAWVPIVHAIEPRTDREVGKRDARNMPWSSCYFEVGGNPDDYLRESGFKTFRVLAPRWAVSGGDIYGNGPGMEALGDVKQLQHEQMRKSQGIDYQTNPPLQVPTALKNGRVDTLPGGVSFVDAAAPHGGIRTAFEVNLDLGNLLGDIQDVRERIRECFYVDLFLMLANQTDTRMTATEVAERHEEKLLMLGPVLERLHNEMLSPLIEMTFDSMLAMRRPDGTPLVPPAPEELQGMELSVEFVSVLAQAQRAVQTNSIDRFVGNLGVVAQMKPDVLDKFDADRWADEYADMLGINPELIVAGEQVALVRQQRAQAQQAAMQQEQAAQAAATAKDLAAADTSGNNALTDATAAFSGYT